MINDICSKFIFLIKKFILKQYSLLEMSSLQNVWQIIKTKQSLCAQFSPIQPIVIVLEFCKGIFMSSK